MRGFSLLEVLIYCALFSLLMVGALGALSAIGASASGNQTSAQLEEEGNFILQKVGASSEGAIVTAPLLGSAGPTLQLTGAGSTRSFTATGSALVQTDEGGSVPLSASFVRVDSFTVAHTGTPGSSESLVLTLLLSATTEEGRVRSASFRRTYYLP